LEKSLSIFDSVPEDRTAVDNIFRLNVTNQMRLNIMADQKANIMITVTAIVFSVTVAELDNELLLYPLLFFAGCCIISLLCAIIAIIPNTDYPKDEYGKLDKKSIYFDPLYFGHFSHMEMDEYKEHYAESLMTDDKVYDTLAKEMYISGRTLALVKYRWLRLSYTSFLCGMIGAMFITTLELPFFSVMWEVFNAQFGLDGIVWSNFREGFCHLMVRCDVNKL
tara:strand:+ start:586 stop:1251 length:666 start_codon:yes stop_codon:yes gene_type:complete